MGHFIRSCNNKNRDERGRSKRTEEVRPGLHSHRMAIIPALVLFAAVLAACGSAASGDTASSAAEEETSAAGTESLAQENAGSTEDVNSAAADTEGTQEATPAEDTESASTEDTEDTKEKDPSDEELAAILEDLTRAHEVNSDVYAFIAIPDTKIYFPIAQNEEDAYYLSHNAEGEEDDDGAIYTEAYNNKDFSDFMTVIYGKNRDDRFAPIHDYGDTDFFDVHRNFTITTLDGTVHYYYIFAAYTGDAYHILLNNDFSSTAVRQEYIYNIQNRNGLADIVKKDVQPTIYSHLITLMTGITGDSDHRYLVQAVEVEDTVDTDTTGGGNTESEGATESVTEDEGAEN